MPSYEHSEPYGRWSQSTPKPYRPPPVWEPSPKPQIQEDTLKSGIIQIERKTFAFFLKENSRGRLLRISEETRGKRNAIIVPATGLAEFKQLLDEMIKAAEEIPSKYPPAAPE
jgi:hypothetical protein